MAAIVESTREFSATTSNLETVSSGTGTARVSVGSGRLDARQVDPVTPSPLPGPSLAEDNSLTFEAFVTGPSSRIPPPGPLTVAETPGRSHNPLGPLGPGPGSVTAEGRQPFIIHEAGIHVSRETWVRKGAGARPGLRISHPNDLHT